MAGADLPTNCSHTPFFLRGLMVWWGSSLMGMGCGCNVSDVGLEGSVGVSPGKGVRLYLGFRRLVHLRCTDFVWRLGVVWLSSWDSSESYNV